MEVHMAEPLVCGPSRLEVENAIAELKKYRSPDSDQILAELILPWSLTLREEHRLRVFENRVLRRIFGPKRDEMKGELRKLHNKLCDLYSSPSIIRIIKSRRMRWAGHVVQMGEKRNVL
jgi:hypothetical protein